MAHRSYRHLARVKACAATIAIASAVLAGPGFAAEAVTGPKPTTYSPYVGHSHPTRVFWGDEHLHTAWSADAGGAGATLDPEAALRFARGEQVVSSSGQPVRLSRPLDWMAVTDHSDGMGTITEIKAGNPQLMADPTVRRWSEMMKAGPEQAKAAVMEMIQAQSNDKLPAVIKDPALAMTVWRKNTAIMEQYNEPGLFTAFIGYEWTSNAGGGNNLHRNVIYRDGKALADQVVPMTTFDSENPEKLWEWMQAWEAKTGGRLLAIPHNGNLSNGRMFAMTSFEGKPLTPEYARTRAKYEPLVEYWQVKGASEVHPSLAPTDEFAAWELWDRGNLALVPKEPGMIQFEYAREALKNGLALQAKLGANPFKFGAAAGSDAHNGLTAMEENNFFGKFVSAEPRPDRWNEDAMKFGSRVVKGYEMSAAGWTGVWATENTRESLWDAMMRREVYATSGPRMSVRFFGGFDFKASDVATGDLAEVGYAKGVPMGGDLQAAPAGKAPAFLVAAARDPIGGNLDRIQIVKGWLDAAGKTHEKIYDVAWGDAARRKPGADGKLPPVGNTVDRTDATFSNAIGDPELIAVWRDPAFDPSQAAFYYARVIEIPTPRWTLYDAVRFGVKMDPLVPMTTQERAVTSPIWYTPK
jgi:hypothetical protein